ncbi:DUF748 domain-containing protein [Marinimicrobium sp. C2-29]|uniref:DUF748 domain-containing protein n=1 Tax=Marinimicrobium sp. C2-29 TaxID=3139825 RepID=UPI0031395963
MKAIKIIVSILVALVVVIAIALFIGLKNLDTLVEAAIESVGPMVTKTDVQVDRVNIKLTEGRGDIHGLAVANPEGYSDRPIIKVSQVGLEIQPSSITEDVVVIREILIDGAVLNAEHQGVNDINIKTLLDQMRPDSPEEPPQSTTASPDVRFMVEKLSFTGATLDLRSEELGQRNLTMRDIQLEELGDRQEGLTPAQLTRAILNPLMQRARERVEQELKSEAEGALKEELEERLSEEDREKVERARSLLD